MAVHDIIVTGSFDVLRARQVRFLEEASRLGKVQVLLYSDALAQALSGCAPKFQQAEREYFTGAIRYVSGVSVIDGSSYEDVMARVIERHPGLWVVDEQGAAEVNARVPEPCGIGLYVIKKEQLDGFPEVGLHGYPAERVSRRKVIVSGCFDWLHSGHVRFFEEVSGLGDLYVVVGNDDNVRFLKGAGHPLFKQDERRYMVQAVRYVSQALVSTGWDYLDYAPQIDLIRPDLFVVNEDGDRPEKRQLCHEKGIQYVVLKRVPKEGLPRRESTKLRGF
jgi:cytidyltransferase-like protein